MSTNYTKNYKLCQWEPSDPVLRTDFNADNAKLETALTQLSGAADQAKALAQNAQATADAAYSPDFPTFKVGYYSGNEEVSRSIDVGFRPKAVLLFTSQGTTSSGNGQYHYGGLSVESCYTYGLSLHSNGFYVSNSGNDRTNAPLSTYIYIAFR